MRVSPFSVNVTFMFRVLTFIKANDIYNAPAYLVIKNDHESGAR